MSALALGASSISANVAAAPKSSAAAKASVCRYFLRGNCRYGLMCRFSHEKITAAAREEQNASEADQPKPSTSRSNLANAAGTMPKKLASTADAATHNRDEHNAAAGDASSLDNICPYDGSCPYGRFCSYKIHLELCNMCDQYCLHPNDQEQRQNHNKECLQQHEQAMELSFAVARSKDKTCGICFEVIMEKASFEKRFGILPNCNHVFCLECIRKWRQAKQFEHKITRACPECRVSSDFVCPSTYWVETEDEKKKLLSGYHSALNAKDCKYFKKGDGKCPFGNKCFYRHALPDGKLYDAGSPMKARKLNRQANEFLEFLDLYLFELGRDHDWMEYLALEDSDFSDYSDDSD